MSHRTAAMTRYRYLGAVVTAELQAVLDAQPGGRNTALSRAAFALGQLVTGAGLDELRVVEALLKAAQSTGLDDREAVRTIESWMRAGRACPRSM